MAVSFAREGCKKIAIADMNVEGLEETAKLMKEAATQGEIEVLLKRVNIVDEAEVADLLDAVVEQLGRVDYCANCAGTSDEFKLIQDQGLTKYRYFEQQPTIGRDITVRLRPYQQCQLQRSLVDH